MRVRVRRPDLLQWGDAHVPDYGIDNHDTYPRWRMPDSTLPPLSNKAQCNEYPRSDAYNVGTLPSPSTDKAGDNGVWLVGLVLHLSTFE